MISVVYITARSLKPMLDGPWFAQGQYELLAESLKKQTYTDYEVVVVDRENPLPRPELAFLFGQVRYVRPRETPWTRLEAFCPSSARNTGLAVARGEIIFGLDDCSHFDGDLFQQIVEWWERGYCLVPNIVRDDVPSAALPQVPMRQERAGGIWAYPHQMARDVNGYDERFDGCLALEDWEFSERLINAGAKLMMHAAARVYLHPHGSRYGKLYRCAHATRELLRGQVRGNNPWTSAQLATFTDEWCTFAGAMDGPNLRCATDATHCDTRERPSAEVVAIMSGYESHPWLNLGAP